MEDNLSERTEVGLSSISSSSVKPVTLGCRITRSDKAETLSFGPPEELSKSEEIMLDYIQEGKPALCKDDCSSILYRTAGVCRSTSQAGKEGTGSFSSLVLQHDCTWNPMPTR